MPPKMPELQLDEITNSLVLLQQKFTVINA